MRVGSLWEREERYAALPMTSDARTLYPSIEPHLTGELAVDDLHTLYFEVSGNPKGKPVVFLHGGPGAGTSPDQRRFFDPSAYRIVLFDQRGCGRSRPHACIERNTTWDLVEDVERLRAHLEVERWQVFGGSWGAALALAYAQKYPARVFELVLRGVFLVRPRELAWYYQEGASRIYPDAWEGFLAPIPIEERGDLIRAYHRRLTSDDEAIRLEAARAWSVWEGSTSSLLANPELVAKTSDARFAVAFSRIECHYFIHAGFLESPNQLLEHVNAIRHIPAVAVHGRYDVVCPLENAWELKRAWPELDLRIVRDAGHSVMEPGTASELVAATDAFR
jgi:proline iminopeptidase